MPLLHSTEVVTGWTLVLRDLMRGTFRPVPIDEEPQPLDYDRYERHVVPARVINDQVDFGLHEITRACQCRPRIEHDHFDEPIVVHEDRKAQ